MKMNDETKAQLQVMWETLNGLLSDVQDCIDRLEAIGIGMDEGETYDAYGVNTKNSFNTPPQGESK